MSKRVTKPSREDWNVGLKVDIERIEENREANVKYLNESLAEDQMKWIEDGYGEEIEESGFVARIWSTGEIDVCSYVKFNDGETHDNWEEKAEIFHSPDQGDAGVTKQKYFTDPDSAIEWCIEQIQSEWFYDKFALDHARCYAYVEGICPECGSLMVSDADWSRAIETPGGSIANLDDCLDNEVTYCSSPDCFTHDDLYWDMLNERY